MKTSMDVRSWDEQDPEVVKAANEVRAGIFAIIRQHEILDHGGQPCEPERMGMVAWIAHSLGLELDDLVEVAIILDGYNKAHDEREPPPIVI